MSVFNDSELRRLEGKIIQDRQQLKKLQQEAAAIGDRERRAISRIQIDTKRDLILNERRQRDVERDIERNEDELTRKEAELQRQPNQSDHSARRF